MKIIYLANVRMPTEKAHGYQIVRTAAAMVEQGAEVELVVPKRRNPKLGNKDPFEYYGVRKCFEIRKLPTKDFIRGNFHRYIGPLAFWLQTWTFARSVKKYLRDVKADWVYGRDELLLSQMRDLPQGAKLAVELHALPSRRYEKLLQRAHRIIVITKAIRTGLVQQGIAPEKIIVATDAVHLDQFSNLPNTRDARRQLGIPTDARVAVYTGHPYPWKGVFRLAEASALLPDNWYVLMVGGLETEIAPIRNYVKSRRLTKVQVLSHQEHSRVPLFLASADVLVLPNTSETDRSRLYTSPLKLFEYLAAGKPIVASDLPSIREVVSESEVIFVAPSDSRDLARGIREAVQHPQEVRVAAAKELVKKYTWEARAQSILDFLEQEKAGQSTRG